MTDEANTAKRLHVKSIVVLFLFCPVLIKLCAYFLLYIYIYIYILYNREKRGGGGGGGGGG